MARQFNPKKHHRRSIRLKGYDYAQPGAYFITICGYKKKHWFGEIKNDVMIPNAFGRIAANEWQSLLERFPQVIVKEYIIMPNHMHGLLIEHLGVMIGAYKSLVADKCLELFIKHRPGQFMGKLWHRNYWERIIRTETAHNNIARYIINNPKNWREDRFSRK